MEDPRNQQRASHLAEETEAEADAILEANNKETADLTVEIDDLGTEIEDLTNTLKEQIKQGTITSQEQYIAERAIVAKQNQKIGSTKVRDEKLQQEVLVDKINQAGLDASLATDPKIKTQMREQQQLLSAQLTNRVNSAQEMLNQAQSMFDEETGRSNGAAKRLADSEIKFENKIKFMQGVEKKSERSFTPLEKASFENLKKKFGANASAMASKDKESKASKKLVADLKALQESQNPTKKDDDK